MRRSRIDLGENYDLGSQLQQTEESHGGIPRCNGAEHWGRW